MFFFRSGKVVMTFTPVSKVKEWICGRRPVTEHMRLLPDACEKLAVAEGAAVEREILDAAAALGLLVERVQKRKLDALVPGANHQGVALLVKGLEYAEVDDIREAAQKSRGFVIALDCVQDPGNLGAILRVADGAGAAGVVITKDRSAGLTPAVARSAAGAAAAVKVARVVNLARELDEFRDAGFWIIGASHEAKDTIFEAPASFPAVLVLGAEGEGIRPNVAKRLDSAAKLPMRGSVASLNVAVAAGVFSYELLRRSANAK